jgi:hypothetical protein
MLPVANSGTVAPAEAGCQPTAIRLLERTIPRQSLANRATDAAEAAEVFAVGDFGGAIDTLEHRIGKIDGLTPAPDWMDGSLEQARPAVDVRALIGDLKLLL